METRQAVVVFSFWLPCVETATKTNTEPQLITKDTR